MDNDFVYMRDKGTGKIAKYPKSHCKIFTNLEIVDSDEQCIDCVYVAPEENIVEVDVQEPAPRKRTKK